MNKKNTLSAKPDTNSTNPWKNPPKIITPGAPILLIKVPTNKPLLNKKKKNVYKIQNKINRYYLNMSNL